MYDTAANKTAENEAAGSTSQTSARYSMYRMKRLWIIPYGVATISRLLKSLGLFRRIYSLL